MPTTTRLARFAADFRIQDAAEDLLQRMKMALLDALAIMLGAAHFARVNGDRELVDYLDATAPPGSATVVGHDRRTTAMMAAFANGILCEVLDCMDCNLTARIHNGAAVTPAVLALAETSGASGRDVLAAMLVGFETGTRLGHAVQPAHWHRGFQITGTYNTCGAAAAAGRLLGLDAQALEAALGASGFIMPVSHGDMIFKGHSVKPIHGGQSALCGIEAAFLARAGYRAGPLEGEPPRHHAALRILGEPDPDLDRAVEGLGVVWATRELAFKPYPIGLLIIGPVEIVLDQLAGHRLSPDEIRSVEVRSYEAARMFTGKCTTVESNYVDAHLSIPFCLAAALTDSEMTVRQLGRERLRDPGLHALARRVTVTEDPAMTERFPYEWPATVTVTLNDGTVREGRVDQVKWSPRRPPSWDDIAEKFLTLGTPVIGSETHRVVEAVAGLESLDTIAPLMESVRRAPG